MNPFRLLRRSLLALSGVILASGALAQDATVNESLEEVVVTGEFPGPGMWKVTRAGDSAGHVLWIVGDPPPLPRRLTWKSREVESVATSAQEILLDATVKMTPDEKIGVFKGLSLLPSALRARKNPEDARLKDILPPEVYARWQVQKKRFLGNDSGVEKWRPIFAANKLREEAMGDLKLRESGMVWEVVGDLAKKHEIPTTTPRVNLTFPTEGLKSRIREFSRESLADTGCLETTLDLTEALSNREVEAQRARAWATADLALLDSLPPLPNPYVPCATALLSSQFAREIVPADLREQLYSAWMDAAEESLDRHPTTLAIVPLAKLTRAGGYLERLRDKGYQVEAPE